MEGWRSWRNGIVTLVGSLGLLIAASPAPAFFIRGGTPPPVQQPAPPVVKTPNQSNGGGGTDTTPPGPTGDGETPPGSIAEPPGGSVTSTPEPASLVSALIGAGLAASYAWRKRRKTPTA
jgi:hypothetical protein